MFQNGENSKIPINEVNVDRNGEISVKIKSDMEYDDVNFTNMRVSASSYKD